MNYHITMSLECFNDMGHLPPAVSPRSSANGSTSGWKILGYRAPS